MEPYPFPGLAKLEGEVIACNCEESIKVKCCGFSGQASGGHYYSSILHRLNDGTAKWYKFDDGYVTVCIMEEEEEMLTQCSGGDYLVDEFHHMLKRISCCKEERWWNCIYVILYKIRRIRKFINEKCK
jgi:ubiquitin carboxyl-terminal hydrolase 9/24